MMKPELLAPAGNLEKLKFAISYGADAIYLGGKQFGLRAFAGNFDHDQLSEAVEYAHQHGVKIYLTVNIFPHNEDLVNLAEYLLEVEQQGVDAIICADLGVVRIARMVVPNLPIHISTQANTVNWSSVAFWQDFGGIERVVLARELSLPEIALIKEKTAMPLECFVHGAMCISYSGRCLLSNYMTDRDSNKGECAQACRWNYNLVEEKRPGEYYPIEEDERGSYIFNSQDLCLLPDLSALIEAGINSFKIEGRMKSAFYVATVLRAYRKMIDQYFEQDPNFDPTYWFNELQKVSHRPYTTGFYFGKPENGALTLANSQYLKPYDFVGVVVAYDPKTQIATIEQRNRIMIGDKVEFFGPNYTQFTHLVTDMINHKGQEIEVAPHPRELITMVVPHEVYPYDLVRKELPL